jgi:hypothetical protein
MKDKAYRDIWDAGPQVSEHTAYIRRRPGVVRVGLLEHLECGQNVGIACLFSSCPMY